MLFVLGMNQTWVSARFSYGLLSGACMCWFPLVAMSSCFSFVGVLQLGDAAVRKANS